MSDTKKRNYQPQPKLFPFIMVWALACFLAIWLYMLLLAELDNLEGLDGSGYLLVLSLGLFAGTSTVQFFVIRRLLHVELRGWMPLSLAGVVAGVIALEVLSKLMPITLSPRLLYQGFFLLVWGLPTAFQWILLRKRFVNHGLWLLAAVVTGPVFSFIFTGDDGWGGGLLTQVLALLPDPDSLWWTMAAYAAGLVAPSVILGMVLYVIVTQGSRTDADDQPPQ